MGSNYGEGEGVGEAYVFDYWGVEVKQTILEKLVQYGEWVHRVSM